MFGTFMALVGNLIIGTSFFTSTTVFEQSLGVYNNVIKTDYQNYKVNSLSDGNITLNSVYSSETKDVIKKDLNLSRAFDNSGLMKEKTDYSNLGFSIYSKNSNDINFLLDSQNLKDGAKSIIDKSIKEGKIISFYYDLKDKDVKEGDSIGNINFTSVPFMKNPLYKRTDLVDKNGETVFKNTLYNTDDFYTRKNGNIYFLKKDIENFKDLSIIPLLGSNQFDTTIYNTKEKGENYVMIGNLFLLKNSPQSDFGLYISAGNLNFIEGEDYEIDNLGKNKLILNSSSDVNNNTKVCSRKDVGEEYVCDVNGYSKVNYGESNIDLGVIGSIGTNYWTSVNNNLQGSNSSVISDNNYLIYKKNPSLNKSLEISPKGDNIFITQDELLFSALSILKNRYGTSISSYIYTGEKNYILFPTLGIYGVLDSNSYNSELNNLRIEIHTIESGDKDNVLSQCHSSIDKQLEFGVSSYCEGGSSLINNILLKNNKVVIENFSLYKKEFNYSKALTPNSSFFSLNLSNGVNYEELLSNNNINELTSLYNSSDIVSIDGQNLIINNSKKYGIYPVINGENIDTAYNTSDFSDFFIEKNYIGEDSSQIKFVDYGNDNYRIKFSKINGDYFSQNSNGITIDFNGIKDTAFSVEAKFPSSFISDTSLIKKEGNGYRYTIPNNALILGEEGNISFDIRNSKGIVINTILLYVKIKRDIKSEQFGIYSGFLKNISEYTEEANPQEINRVYKNLSTNDSQNYFRVNPFDINDDVLGNLGDEVQSSQKFFKSIVVEVDNLNRVDFYIEPVLTHFSAGSTPTINTKTVLENGKYIQRVSYELRNIRGFPNGSQGTFFVKLKREGVQENVSSIYNLDIKTKIKYSYYDGEIPNFYVEKNNGLYDVKYNENEKGLNTYNIESNSHLYVDLTKNNGQYSSLNLVHPCGYDFPVFDTRFSKNESFSTRNLTSGDQTCASDSIGGYGYFNLIQTFSKPKISSEKYDNLRIRQMYFGDGDGDGAGFGIGGSRNPYSWNKFPMNGYQYSLSSGNGASDFYDGRNNSWWDNNDCGSYHYNESLAPNDLKPSERLPADNITGKPNVRIKELLFSTKIDSFYKEWKTGTNGEGTMTPSMLSPIDYMFPSDLDTEATDQTRILLGYTKDSSGKWKLTYPNNFLKFPYMMAKHRGDGTIPPDDYTMFGLPRNWKSYFINRGVNMADEPGSISIAGNSPYIKYDLDTKGTIRNGVYKDGFELHLPSWMNGTIDKIYLTWNEQKTETSIFEKKVAGQTETYDRQGWRKMYIYNSIRIVLKDNNPSYIHGQSWQDLIKNTQKDMIKLVWPVTSPGTVNIMKMANTELSINSDYPTVANLIDGIFVLKNALRDNGLLKYKTYFNAKQTYSTTYRIGHYEHIIQYYGKNCSRSRIYHIPHYSYGTHVFSDGYYYNQGSNGKSSINPDPNSVNSNYYYLGGARKAGGLIDLMFQEDIHQGANDNNSTFLSTSQGNYFLRFQTMNEKIAFSGPRYMRESKKSNVSSDSNGIIYLKDEEYRKIKNMIFDGDKDLHKSSIRDYFMNNSKIHIVKSENSIDEDIKNSYTKDKLANDEVKVYYYGTKSISLQNDIRFIIGDNGEKTLRIGKTDYNNISVSGLRVFITDGDVLINGNVNFGQNTSDNAYGPVIIATNPSHGNIYVGSRPDVYEGLLVRNNLIVDYNYKMFLVNGGALIRNNITCDRFALQVPEVFSEGKDGIYSGLINKDGREGYAYNALRNSCTVINNTKFSNFTLRKEFGQTKN